MGKPQGEQQKSGVEQRSTCFSTRQTDHRRNLRSEKTGKHPRNFLYLFHFLETGTDKSPSINCRENEVLIYIFAGQYTNI